MAERHKIVFKRKRLALGGGNDGLFYRPAGVGFPLMNSTGLYYNSTETNFNKKI